MGAFRFAIMGAGGIARKFCAAARLLEGCSVAAVASKSMERAHALAQECDIPAWYDSYEAMLVKERPDCVYIAVTPNDHFALSMLCVRHGIPVLCEKAMFTCGQEAKTLFEEAQKRRVFAMEALWSRFLPAVDKARDWLHSGCIGDVLLADTAIGFPAPSDPMGRYFSKALAGGAATDITVYGYMLTTWLLDRQVEERQVMAVPAATGVDATEVVSLRFAGNALAVIKTSFMTRMEEQMTVYGGRGKIVLPHPHYASEAFLYGADGACVEHFVDDQTENGFTYQLQEVMRCIAEGRLESRIVPQRDTLACACLFDDIRRDMGR